MKIPQHLGSSMNYKKFAIVCGILVSVLYFASVLVFKNNTEHKRSAQSDFVRFSKFPKDSVVDASLETANKAFPLSFSKGAVFLPDELVKDFKVPYTLLVSFKNPEGESKDIKISLDNRGVLYSVLLDGFSPEDKVSLTLKGSTSVSNAYFDWSGRLKLEALVNPFWDTEICVKAVTKEPIEFCQTIIGKQGAA